MDTGDRALHVVLLGEAAHQGGVASEVGIGHVLTLDIGWLAKSFNSRTFAPL